MDKLQELDYLAQELKKLESLPPSPPEVEEYLGEKIIELRNQIGWILIDLHLTIN